MRDGEILLDDSTGADASGHRHDILASLLHLK
jgi:hypothetical protein